MPRKTKSKKTEKYPSYLKDQKTKKVYKNVIEEYTSVARMYEDKWKKYLASTEAAILKQLKLKGNETIVDAGCGTGSLIAALREKKKHRGKILGFDITPAMLDLAEARLSKDRFNKTLQLELAHCENFSAKNNSVDIVLCSNVFNHLPHPEKALHEFRRVLKKNGKLILVTLCNDYPSTKIADWIGRILYKGHHRAHSSAEVDALLKKQKFTITDFKTWKATHILGVMLFEAKKR